MLGFIALTFAGLAILVQQHAKWANNQNHEDCGTDTADPGIPALLILAICLATLPAGIWVYSYLAGPVFLDRYLWPVVVIAWCIVVADGTRRILGDCRSSSDTTTGRRSHRVGGGVPKFVLGLLGIFCLIVPLQTQFHAPAALRDFLQRFSDLPPAFPHGLPVVFEDPLKFVECKFYHDRDNRYFVLLDKDWALNAAKETFRPNLFAIGSALQRQYSVNALPATEFLAQHDRFVFVPTHGELFDKWIRFNGEYSWTRTNRGRWHFYVVSRRGG
jgi:hypothetical protein